MFPTTTSDIASIATSAAIIFGMYKLDRGAQRQRGLMEGPGDLQDQQIDEFMKRCGKLSALCTFATAGNGAFLYNMGGGALSWVL
ncbi:hypothetical protein CLAFUW4_09244 [Fulvia fulva]|uniref:Uncharacterized protein n=1 Tax=Passalora fulva TaxID=5499 RepID=A0A9Q8PFS0_PASFU|nr:uncharacterized protein CLAFUR5_09345 [Fulvia fulva]KAK4613814.1 hypothetical protein CLAFUR4_09250 [Fulvia fulva]KAK4614414.1 hypothetical protein CLAFUR0_09242 [Fulvia fulva]UJO21605.1 hypothetical protein CLAFUR5_09345 [Fulvia fulva]WPV20761.1 hypothetical protein CLAFUW4_09244 [Fulvia fulva]WPV34787.1 hypothetical protein CLAFUW7_09245 [Fulvia fulva]